MRTFRAAKEQRRRSRLRNLRTGAKQATPQGFWSFRSRDRGFRLEPEAVEALHSRSDWPNMLQRGLAWLRELDEINRLPADVERYRAIDAPTLLIYGTGTQPRRRTAVATLAEAIPNAKVIAFSGHGHDVANTAAEEVASAVAAFLEE